MAWALTAQPGGINGLETTSPAAHPPTQRGTRRDSVWCGELIRMFREFPWRGEDKAAGEGWRWSCAQDRALTCGLMRSVAVADVTNETGIYYRRPLVTDLYTS